MGQSTRVRLPSVPERVRLEEHFRRPAVHNGSMDRSYPARPNPPGWLAAVWEWGAVLGAISVLVVAGYLWLAADHWVDAFDQTLILTSDALGSTTETIDILDETMAVLGDAALRLGSSVDGAADTVATVAEVASDTSILLSEDLPADLDAIRASLDGLIDTANVIDGILGALSFVGVDYDPAVPLDEALIELDARIAALPDRLRSQAVSLAEVADGMEGFAADADAIADDLDELRSQVLESQSVLATYRVTAEDGLASVGEARAQLDETRIWLRFLAVTLAGTGLLSMSAVWWQGRAGRLRSAV